MGSWNRRNHVGTNENQDDYKDLLVFGYPSTIFPNDYQSEHIAEERHMVPCLGDAANRVDRYDCRLLLPSLESALQKSEDVVEACPTEAMEEDMCEEERYLDMYQDIQKAYNEEEKRRKEQRSAIGFDYGSGGGSVVKEESDSEDEPFEPPSGVKFPVGLELPPNMKQHHIIEKTASFIVANGNQMEIVIKAKQRNNAEQFGFLEFDNRLNPFYKYLQKLIREKKYEPDLTKRPKKLTKTANSGSSKPATSSSLAAIAAAHGSDSDSDDSDSDCELHPSLLSGASKRPLTPEKPGTIGPKTKPFVAEKIPEMSIKPTEDISKRNDVYAALFKNLTSVTQQASGKEEKSTEQPSQPPEKTTFVDSDGRLHDPDYQKWFESFYGRPCPWIGPRPMLPPTPDLEPILNNYAEHVAQKGAQFEETLASRKDLQLHFMDPKSPYYSFYHHKIRVHQWKMSNHEYNNIVDPVLIGSPTPNFSIPGQSLSTVSSPGPSSLMSIRISTPPEPPLNRRQRRRLLESSRVDENVTEPGIFDPLSCLPKSASTPANLPSLDDVKPVSFTLKQTEDPKEDSSFRFDPDLEDFEEKASTSSVDDNVLPPPPVPANILNSTQIDRKEKARIFMEKLLLEKKLMKEQEDEERRKLEDETRRKAEKISESLSSGRDRRDRTPERSKKTLDDIINSRIKSLLSESGFQTVDETKKDEDESEEDERKKHRKRSRSRRRSRSRDRSKDRKKSRKSDRRHRSRSSSRDRHRRRHRSDSRNRSRDRSYRY